MDADRRKQNDLSRANIVRAQVIFLCSTLNDDNWEDKLQELKKVFIPSLLHPIAPLLIFFLYVVGGRIRRRSVHYKTSKVHRNKCFAIIPSKEWFSRSNWPYFS